MGSRPVTGVGRKLALAVGLPVLVSAMAAVYYARDRAQELVHQNAVEEAAALADLVSTSFSLAEEDPLKKTTSPEQAHRQVNAAMRADYKLLQSVAELRIVDRDGKVRWSRRLEEVGQHLADAPRLLAAPPQGSTDVAQGEYIRPLGGMACARCHSGDAFKVGALQVTVRHPRIADDVEGLFSALTLAGLALFAALVLATTFIMRRLVTQPLSELAGVMQKAEQGDFLVRAKVASRDEIGQLAREFNSMLGRLTELKVAEIEAIREREVMQRELALKAEVEKQHKLVEETNRALARRVREMTLLFDITRSLNSTLELNEILSLVTEMVGVTLGVDQCTVMLLEEGSKTLRVSAGFGIDEASFASFLLPVGQGASGIAAQSRESVYLPDVNVDPRYVKNPQQPAERDQSLLSVPMICKEKLVGVLNYVRHAKNAFSENDVMLLKLVSSQAAMAIVNARLYSETKELSLTDELTGAFNRRHLFARLEMEIARSQRFHSSVGVVMIDIDHFKHLNDTSGHPAGDQALKEVSDLLRHSIRKVDTLARYGGEEFVVVLPQVTREEAFEVADKLRKGVEKTHFPFGERQPGGRLTISLGVAVFPADGDSLEKVVDASDSALYASKRGGRNQVNLFAPGMDLHPGRERGPAAEQRLREGEPETGATPDKPAA